MSIFKRNKKINFEEVNLILCKLCMITEYETLYNPWRVKAKKIAFPETRILVRLHDNHHFYEPNNYSESWREPDYSLYNIDEIVRYHLGMKLVEKTDGIPIQRIPGITFTEKELKTKKISLKRIKEIEDLLNSNLQNLPKSE